GNEVSLVHWPVRLGRRDLGLIRKPGDLPWKVYPYQADRADRRENQIDDDTSHPLSFAPLTAAPTLPCLPKFSTQPAASCTSLHLLEPAEQPSPKKASTMRPKPHVSSLALVAAMLATVVPATAQQTMLDALRITAAGLTPFEENEIGRSFTVISGDQIQLSGTAYVADVLRQVPGFAVSRGGSHGGLTDVRVRGAEANHVLVLIDGVPASENSTGGFDFGRLAVTNVERIEILRGPQSAFWG